MEIHWVGLTEIDEAERERAQARLQALAEGHSDLIDVRITGRTTRHHQHGEQEVRITKGRTARVVRERYEAPLSLAYQQGGDLFMLAGDELPGRRAFELGGLADHLSQKLGWVESLPDHDRIARFRVHGLEEHPERLGEVISEIAMGRSILEC